MCVVCKRRAPKKTLRRYAVAVPGSPLTPDPGQKVQARSLYHCDAPACCRAFARRLKKVTAGEQPRSSN
ncbi:YlxR family protein [Desulfovibrio sp. OttesenSCG-928-G11]|nr:YlxR family protein [Desulfovibrio sp. OttesenSCG-928-G11]